MADEPLRITTFTLTRADALAYEQASSRSTPLGTAALILWLGLCGAAAWLIPADWSGPRFGWSFPALVSVLIAIGYVLVLLAAAFRQWLRAGKRLSRPQETTLGEWRDRLEITTAGVSRTLPLLDIRESILTRSHLFLVGDDNVLIVPQRAFAEEGVIEEMAARIAGRPVPARVGERAAL
jgi:hypothetical protein